VRCALLLCLLLPACLAPEPAPALLVTSETTASTGTASGSGPDWSPTTLVDEPDNDFISRPDGAHSNECDPYAQTCPSGQKCAWTGSPHSPETTRCVPLAPVPLPDGAACDYNVETLDGIDECGRWAVCLERESPEQDGVGVCVAMCRGSYDHPYCDDNAVCVGGRTMWLCDPLCDPFAQDCPEQLRCDLLGTAPVCLYDAPGQPKQPTGGACSALWDCERGSTCIAGVMPECEGGCCTPLCRRDDPDAKCPVPGQQCLPLSEDPVAPGTVSVGVCGMEAP